MKAGHSKGLFWTSRTRLLLVLLAASGLVASGAVAQDTGQTQGQDQGFGFEIQQPSMSQAQRERLRYELTHPGSTVEAGALYNTTDSFKFGDFTGLEQKQLYFLGNIDIRRQAPWDSGKTWHFRLLGENLGLSSRYLHAEYGQQGRYDLWAEFEETPKFRSDSTETFFAGRNSSLLTLPPGWVASTTVAGLTQLNTDMRRYSLKLERDAFRTGFSLQLPSQWSVHTRYQRERKEGNKLVAALIGINGGDPHSALVPEPFDYTTNQLDADLSYAGKNGQLQLGYYLSAFHNAVDSLSWQVPFSGPSGAFAAPWDPSAEQTNPCCSPTAYGRKATAPDNSFHQLTAQGGYNLPLHTRVMANLAFGWMFQNQDFLPFTVNPVLAASITTPLPRSSLDGKIRTTLLNFRIASNPIKHLRIDASYRYDDRHNETPQDLYIYIPNDATTQGMISDSTARLNRPYSYTQNKFNFDVGYEFFRRTEFSIGYERNWTDRTFTEVAQNRESIYKAELRSQPWSLLSFRLDVKHSMRTGSNYDGAAPLFNGSSAAYVATLPANDFENAPQLRKYYEADRKRNEVGFSTTLMPIEALSFTFSTRYGRDAYTNSVLGLASYKTFTYSFDASWSPIDAVTTYAYYTVDTFRSVQNGHSFSGGSLTSELMQLADPANAWVVADEDRSDTFGLGGTWKLLQKRLELGADFVYTRSNDLINLVAASDPTAPPFPASPNWLQEVSLHAKYKVNDHVSMRVGYLFERLAGRDWSFTNVDPATLSEVISAGQTFPAYHTHLITVSMIYKFY